MASASDKESLTCPVCLDILENPKLLPRCHHTFCAQCIQGVADTHQGRPFPCPSCREETTLPSGGAAALRKNFYIKDEDLVRARQGIFHCGVHRDQRLDLYCDDCQKILCLKCAMTKHNEHKKRDLSEAATDAESQLKEDKDRIQTASRTIESRIQVTTKELQALRNKREAVEKNIRSRHATAVAALNKYLEESLTSLKETCEPLEKSLTTDLNNEQQNKNKVEQLQKKLQDVLDKHIDCHLVDVAKDMRDGQGTREAIDKLIPQERKTCDRPVLRCNSLSSEDMARHLKDYLGTVHKMEYTVRKDDETSVERFGIAEEPGTEIFSMCVQDSGLVNLSYAWQNLSNAASAQEFDRNGSRTATFKTNGKASYKSRGKKAMRCLQTQDFVKTNSKSKEHFSLLYNLKARRATVEKMIIKSEDPFQTEDKEEFTIQCGLHRAFDVDSTGELFVIVEEANAPNLERKVRLYRRPQAAEGSPGSKETPAATLSASAIATYTPPLRPFKPSDVCFFRQEDCGEYLLIADELNDAIHIADRWLKFKGYLCPGHPALVQPTALTVDSQNRVWVACRDRIILVVEPRCFQFQIDDVLRIIQYFGCRMLGQGYRYLTSKPSSK